MPVGFSYAMVEAALVELHGIAPDGVPALRSRFGAFQRGGLLGKQPGRGARLQYGPDELHRVVLAFELTQMGMSPTTVLWLVREVLGQAPARHLPSTRNVRWCARPRMWC